MCDMWNDVWTVDRQWDVSALVLNLGESATGVHSVCRARVGEICVYAGIKWGGRTMTAAVGAGPWGGT
jgi:hypothetical protein